MSHSSQALVLAAASGALGGAVLAALALDRRFWRKQASGHAEAQLPVKLMRTASSHTSMQANAQTPHLRGGETPLWHAGWSAPKVEKAGIAPHVTLQATLPYTVQPHADESPEMLLTTCNVYLAPSIQEMVHSVLRTREVAGIPGVKFGDIVDIVLNKGASRVYVSGGFLRDAFCGHVGDDMDFLLRSMGGSLVPFLEAVSKAKGWPVNRKSDEKTGQGRWDFIAIGDKEAKMKWSAHPCGSGCEGDFCMNTLLYDIHSGALIDPTGKGIQDSVNFILRHNRGNFTEWVEEDRLPGMKLIRYFNFVSRGYSPPNHDFRREIVQASLKILATSTGKITTGVFLKRKLIRGSAQTSLQKEAQFRNAMITEMVKSGHASRADAVQWYMDHVASCYGSHLQKFPGLEGKVEQPLKQMLEDEGLQWKKPWSLVA